MTRLILFAALLCLPTIAAADKCTIRVNAMDLEINIENFANGPEATRRERLLSWPSRQIDWLTGDLPVCTSDITIAFIAGIEGYAETDGLCLIDGDENTGLLLIPGERNFRGRCKTSTCEKVNGVASDMVALSSNISEFVYAPPDTTATTLTHASGALMMTATRSYLQRSLETGATTLGAYLGSPAIAAGAVATVVVVGGGVWYCSE